jgi:hypothetical protein
MQFSVLRDATVAASLSVDSAGALRAASLLRTSSPQVGACVLTQLQKVAVEGKTPVTLTRFA